MSDYNRTEFQVWLKMGSQDGGRFTSRKLNHLYGYVEGNPVRFIDKFGLWIDGVQDGVKFPSPESYHLPLKGGKLDLLRCQVDAYDRFFACNNAMLDISQCTSLWSEADMALYGATMCSMGAPSNQRYCDNFLKDDLKDCAKKNSCDY